MTSTLPRLAAIAALAVAISACDLFTPPPPETFTVSKLEFRNNSGTTVESNKVPASGGSMRATFNDGVEANTLISANISLKSAGGGSIKISINGANFPNSATITPLSRLTPGTNYTLTFGPNIKSMNGANLVTKSFTFTVDPNSPGPQPVGTGTVTTQVKDPTSLVLENDNSLLVADVSFGGAFVGSKILRFAISGTPPTAGAPQTIKTMTGQTVTGIALHEGALWITHADINAQNSAKPDLNPYSSALMRCTGANYATCQDVITGMPRSAELHQVNGIDFGTDGRAYIAVGGFTNYGGKSSLFANRAEVLMGAAILVADLDLIAARGGTINVRPQAEGGQYPITRSNLLFTQGGLTQELPVKVYATGLRNPYDLVWTAEGALYSTDNGGNVGYGTTPGGNEGCSGTPFDPGNSDDEINLIQPGKYYGHPNPARGECVYNGGANYVVPAARTGVNFGSDGVAEYIGPDRAASGVMNGDLLFVNYAVGDSLFRFRPDTKEVKVVETPFNNPLDVIVRPSDGTIFVAEFGNPYDEGGTGATIKYVALQ